MFLFTPPIAFSFRELFTLLNNLNNLLGAGNFLPLTLVSLVLSSDFMVEDVSEEEGGGKKKVSLHSCVFFKSLEMKKDLLITWKWWAEAS